MFDLLGLAAECGAELRVIPSGMHVDAVALRIALQQVLDQTFE
jgi:hypothetical protein